MKSTYEGIEKAKRKL